MTTAYYVLGSQNIVYLVAEAGQDGNPMTALEAMKAVAKQEGVAEVSLLPHNAANRADMEALVLTMANGLAWAAKGVGQKLIEG